MCVSSAIFTMVSPSRSGPAAVTLYRSGCSRSEISTRSPLSIACSPAAHTTVAA